jgi:uncharacterized phage-associated protein
MFLVGFNGEKAAQVAKWFVSELGGRTDKLKLIKLIYLAEREFMSRHDEPMLYDEFYSLQHGPICSNTLDSINGRSGAAPGWGDFHLQSKSVVLDRRVVRQDLDHLSDADVQVLRDVYAQFGWMSASQLRKYTHENCPEYQQVGGGRIPIHYIDIFKALGHPDPAAASEDVSRHRRLSGNFVA